MRIISGNFRGKKLFLPNDKLTRPLKDVVNHQFNYLFQQLTCHGQSDQAISYQEI